MKPILLFLLPLGIFLLWIIGRGPKSQTSSERPDFIRKASESRFISDGSGLSIVSKADNSDYNYDVVGESFQRDHLTALIRTHNAFESG